VKVLNSSIHHDFFEHPFAEHLAVTHSLFVRVQGHILTDWIELLMTEHESARGGASR
jgi:hypothetical protein